MTLLPIFLSSTLLAIAALHFAWGAGVNWPVADEERLAKLVVGARGITKMPPGWAAMMVAAALCVGAGLVLGLGGLVAVPLPSQILSGLGWIMAAVFTFRGLAGFLPVWQPKLEPEFARLNTRYYSPLCLLIGAGTVALLV
ncbi:Protein of unknown function [Aliiroseovarius halocynthiae]|uniref:DUF3995 domain-containing protein n=1 Tax=Aliiroseovarius halocynthiae TaxID=985055 RepID=A0A545SN15_9RHOB|nr:DUF3995 domain-containing protein [Aliiroseovarius halocynthiae]TQV66347.1 DUF3995 domain-containing protein [Aliiroseovarius halocynthiae]SMR83320.1 Protein of unknown function [Aliiroseovarius halocynthiae]